MQKETDCKHIEESGKKDHQNTLDKKKTDGGGHNRKQHNQHKASKPYREIYRPPSLRSKGNRGNSNKRNSQHITPETKHGSSASENLHDSQKHNGHHSPMSHSPMLGRKGGGALNANAKEFQAGIPQQSHQHRLMNALLNHLDPGFVYSLQQSKSLGNNLNVLMGYQQPVLPYGYNQGGSVGAVNTYVQRPTPTQSQQQFNRLAQSKSSGSIPSIGEQKPRVRFEDEVDDNLNRKVQNLSMQNDTTPSSDVPIRSIQKSRTGFLLNMYTPPTQRRQMTASGCDPSDDDDWMIESPASTHSVKRSKSFNSGCINRMPVVHSTYSDFQISRWPKLVQEVVISAVTAVDKVAARQYIELVNVIFDAMLTQHANLVTTDEPEIIEDLTAPAVHIILYFVQKERERTVMESLLNTCFATHQKLFGSRFQGVAAAAAQYLVFLKFLSTLYSQVKLAKRQKKSPLDEMSFSLLALLCDTCLGLLRSPLSDDLMLMECLFTVMTSEGRDMETTFPQKMKMILAAVRDTLLGLGPYAKSPLPFAVQKTLMQLIELHAANWALPASAVRYYYANNASHNKGAAPVNA